jgi:hypothetical protein
MEQHTTWTVRVRCGHCGIVRVNGTQTVLRVAEHDDAAELRFQCVQCGRVDLHAVDDEQAAALIDADIRIEWRTLPAIDPPLAADGIDAEEIDRFTALLADDAGLSLAVEQLASTQEQAPGHA